MAWPGGKDGAGVHQRLINQIPPHDVFVSAFLGDCAILRRKLPAATSYGIDLDEANVKRWAETQRLPGLRLYCCDGVEWLRHYFGLYLVGPPEAAAVDRPKTFVYIDAPYLMASRRTKRLIYRCEMTTEEDHDRLLVTATALPCQVMISHYPHPLYEARLASWRSFTFTSQTRGGKPATEKVWCNYPEPEELHDARFVGGNKRVRERIRRRVRNWTAGLARMLPDERQAVLDAIEAKWLVRPTATNSAPLQEPTSDMAARQAGGG